MSLIVSNLSLGVPGGGGGLTQIDVGNTAFVDGVNGNDGTGAVGRQDLPYATIGAALAAVTSGQAVLVFPGTYAESGLTVNAGVRLVSSAGWPVTSITGAAATGTRVTLAGDGASVEGFKITVPTDAAYGVENTTTAGQTGSVFFCTFIGQPGSVGYGVGQTGTGKTISLELRFTGGDAAGLTLCAAGVLATQANHVPAGANLAAVWDVTGGRFQGSDLNVGSPTVVDALRQSGGVVRVFTANWFNVGTAVHFTGNAVDCSIQNGEFDNVDISVLVDAGLTLAGATIRITANHQPVYSFPPAALGADFAVSTFQRGDDTLDAAYSVFGVPLASGFPELGQEARLGEGGPYNAGQLVIQATGATAGTDGGSFVDVSTEAASKTGSPFGFATAAAGDVLYFGSLRQDSGANLLKHWGIRMKQNARAVGGSFAFEIWDGAAWAQVGVLAASVAESYYYANELFGRTGSLEDIRFGIDDSTAWATKSINGSTAYWSRVRVLTAPSTPPQFEQAKLHPSASLTSSRGVVSSIGLGHHRGAIGAGGNIFGESGTVVAAAEAIGTGGAFETWTHDAPNSLLNSAGDAIYATFEIADGVCTAHPLTIALNVTFDTTGSITAWPVGVVSLYAAETSGVLVADPAGGIAPVARTLANTSTLTAAAAQFVSQDLQPAGAALGGASINGIQHRIEFGPFDVSSFYPGDTLYIRFELNADGTPAQDVYVSAISVEAVEFQPGRPV